MMVQRGGVSQISCTQQKEAANSQDMSITANSFYLKIQLALNLALMQGEC